MARTGPNVRAEGQIDRLIFHRFFRTEYGKIFVDVGAAGPEYISNSAFFREMGWRVLAIEPNPAYAEQYHRRDLELLPYACGDEDRDGVDFTIVHSHGIEYAGGTLTYESMSALKVDPRLAGMRGELVTSTIKVDLRRLDTLLAMHAPEIETIDILSVDVEGSEMDVLRGLCFRRWRPRICIIENLWDDPGHRIGLRRRGYRLWARAHPNEVYVRKDLLTRHERAACRVRGLARSALLAVRRWVRRTGQHRES